MLRKQSSSTITTSMAAPGANPEAPPPYCRRAAQISNLPFPSVLLAMDYRLLLALLCSIALHMTAMLSLDRLPHLTPPGKDTPLRIEISLLPKPQEQVATQEQPADSSPEENASTEGKKENLASLPPTPVIPTVSPTEPSVEKKAPPSRETQALASSPPPSHPQERALHQAIPNSSTSTPPPPETLETTQPSAQELIAALEGRLAKGFPLPSQQPRKRHLDFRTKDYTAMAYLDAWCKKIERVGKMNYPEQAKRQGLSGSLSLVVDLNPDGSLANVMVRRSSGYKILDEAAVRIVQLAAPFAKVPESILQGHEILSITRRWKFHSNTDFRAH